MDLSKIKTLIDFVGRSNVVRLVVTEQDVTVRIFRDQKCDPVLAPSDLQNTGLAISENLATESQTAAIPVKAPIFGVLHRAPAPDAPPFVTLGASVEEGQTLFVIEAMKVFNAISSPRSGRIVHLTDIDGGEVEPGNVLAEIA
ncbi:acetyl-CoA carboxylase biotin carboxyl carrier protein [Allorhizobium taibaishanense]|uniref:Biotin carboxyl carrier protein of acetyl-CoA carboxylase n=1 Tax=Allorhizobium taibaishanense TaxID=887144 RepID=A0A1Q9A7G8_9HYPH|nr:biotin/lipoyl-containing protein [Allorhizobium taibaishanense]MBB4008268.1 acetyl-CoA carboxylase biotin carboxyl carrier protein [Allorhizobium taibaishanense]OLP50534.1 acetyl-CoA carboxylase biotin carboxyl carrier protein subunit [Allorhizobium taibaishanense]